MSTDLEKTGLLFFFFLLNQGKSLTLAEKRPVKRFSFKVVSVTVVVKLGSRVNN